MIAGGVTLELLLSFLFLVALSWFGFGLIGFRFDLKQIKANSERLWPNHISVWILKTGLPQAI